MHPVVLFLYGIWTITLYVLPTAIAFSRKKKHRWLIAVINILGGWIYGVPWLISLVWALLALKTDGSKGFKAWPVGLGLVVAPFLFGAFGAAINLQKETNEVVQASATPAVQEAAAGTLTAMPAQQGAAGAAAASMTPIGTPVEQPAATPTPVEKQSLELPLRPSQRRLRHRSRARYAGSTTMCLRLTLKRILPK